MTKKEVNFTGRTFVDQDLAITQKIGSGNWSVVYGAFDIAKTQKFAVKVISEKIFQDTPKIGELTRAEINILKQCDNPNVVKFVKAFTSDGYHFTVIEFCNGGDLGEKLRNEGTLAESLAISYLKQILNGFRGLHEIRAMHRDFKVQNVMLHNDDICKIVDLGFGKQLIDESVTRTKLGSNMTMAPEVMQHKPYDFTADIWSIGVVYYQLLQDRFPFIGRNIEIILEKINNDEIRFDRHDISDKSIDFIKKCLVVDPKKRISWKDIYMHPLIKDSKSEFLMMMEEESSIDLDENYSFYQKYQHRKEFKPSLIEQFAHKIEVSNKDKIQNISKGSSQVHDKIDKQSQKGIYSTYKSMVKESKISSSVIEPVFKEEKDKKPFIRPSWNKRFEEDSESSEEQQSQKESSRFQDQNQSNKYPSISFNRDENPSDFSFKGPSKQSKESNVYQENSFRKFDVQRSPQGAEQNKQEMRPFMIQPSKSNLKLDEKWQNYKKNYARKRAEETSLDEYTGKRYKDRQSRVSPKKQQKIERKSIFENQEFYPKKEEQPLVPHQLQPKGRYKHFKEVPKSDNNAPYSNKLSAEDFKIFCQEYEIRQQARKVRKMYYDYMNDYQVVFLSILPRFCEVKFYTKKVLHEKYMALLIKDSYHKLKSLCHDIERQQNIFGVGDIFPYFNYLHKINLVKILNHQLDLIQKEYYKYSSEHLRNDLNQVDRVELTFLNNVHQNWKFYLCDQVKSYWKQIAFGDYNHTAEKRILLYIYCLRMFQKFNRNGHFSYDKLSKMIQKFKPQIERKYLRNNKSQNFQKPKTSNQFQRQRPQSTNKHNAHFHNQWGRGQYKSPPSRPINPTAHLISFGNGQQNIYLKNENYIYKETYYKNQKYP